MFLFAIFIVFKSPFVQTKIIKKISLYLSDYLGTKINIGSVDFAFFDNFIFNDLIIYDQFDDTLLYVKTLIINTNILKLNKDSIYIRNISFDLPRIKIKNIDSTNYNFTFLLKTFESSDTTSSSPLNIAIKNLEIKKGQLLLVTNSEKKEFKKFYFDGLNLSIKNFFIKNEDLGIIIKEISFVEKIRSFKLKNLTADILKNKKKLEINKFVFETSHSFFLLNKLIFSYDNFDDLLKFNENIKVFAEIKSSSFFFKEFDVLLPIFKKFTNEKIALSGIIKGNLSNLKTRNLLLSISNNTYVKGDYNIIDITTSDKTFFVLNFDTLAILKNDIEFIKNFVNNSTLDLFSGINKIYFKGNVQGFLNNFVTSGCLETDIGKIISNVKVLIDTTNKSTNIEGSIITENFDIAKVLKENKLFGSISLKSNLKLTLTQKGFKGKGKLNISKFYFNDYQYTNINVEGEFTNKFFDGVLNVEDPNIKFSFLGKIDLSSKIPVFNFMADFNYIKLNKLNLIHPDSQFSLSFMIDSKITGKDISNINGSLNIYQAKFFNKNDEYNLKDIFIDVVSINNKHYLNVNSDFISIDFKGDFVKETLFESIKQFVHPFLRLEKFNSSIKNTHLADFKTHLILKIKYHPLYSYFLPFIKKFCGVNLNAELSKNLCKTNLKIDSLFLSDNTEIKLFNLDSYLRNDSLIVVLSMDSLKMSNDNYMCNVIVYNSIKNNEISTTIKTGNNSPIIKDSRVYLKSNISNKIFPISIEINPSFVTLMNEKIFISSSSFCIDTNKVKINYLRLSTLNQELKIYGNIGSEYTDSLRIYFKNILLSQVNMFTAENDFTFDGKINGEATILGVLKTPVIIGNLSVDTLIINKENFGKFDVSAIWDNKEKKINYNIKSYRGKIKTIDVEGYYDNNNNNIYANVFLDKWRLNLLEPFVKSFSSEVRGNLSGNLQITGKIDKPEINGLLNLVKAAIKIDYLNTRYNFTGDVSVSTGSFELKNIDLYDTEGNLAKLNGKITHNYFSNIYVDFNINTQRFMCLNTQPSPEQLYFGKIFTTGIINIQGFVDKVINIEANVQTDRGSSFFLNLESTEELSERPYVKFVSPARMVVEENKNVISEDLGLTLNFNIQATPYANVEMIFNSKTNDVLKARGTGNLRIQLSNKGIFTIYGNYEISEGSYMFSIRNVTKKEFSIVEGSNIIFNGDPLNAKVNIKTLYSIRTNLIELMLDSTYRERTTVNCYLNLTDKLTQPALNFQIEIPDADSKVASVLNSLSEEEKSKQFISLLVINKFITPELYRGGIKTTDYNPIGTNTSEYFTNQINNWLSSISKNVNVKINYRPGTELSNEEMAVALNTQILNDRISIYTNFGMSTSNQADQSYLIGDFELNAIISKNKKFRMKVFNRTNNRIFKENSPYTQGIGLTYSDEFDSLKELYQRLNKK